MRCSLKIIPTIDVTHWLSFKQDANFSKNSEWCAGGGGNEPIPIQDITKPSKSLTYLISNSVSTDTNEVFRNQQNERSIPAEYFLAIDLFRQPIQYSFLRINVLVIIETGIVQCLHHRRYVRMMMSTLMDKNCLKISTYTVKQSQSAKTWWTSVQEKKKNLWKRYSISHLISNLLNENFSYKFRKQSPFVKKFQKLLSSC